MLDALRRFVSKPAKKTKSERTKAAQFFDGFRERAIAGGGFHGGQSDRLNDDWKPGTIGPNRMVQMNGQLLRERAWDLYINNPFANSVIDAMLANVIECGLLPERDESWEKSWARWGGLTAHSDNDADLTRDQTINELQITWLREVFVGGGALVHYRNLPRRSQEIPLALEIIGEERFAEHVMQAGPNPKTANPVYNGIEVDVATGRTVAWHVRKGQPNDLNFDPEEAVRIPVQRGHYSYFKWRANAKRGTTKLRTVISWLWSIGYYADNELINSDIKSRWAYMILTDGDSDVEWADLNEHSESTVDAYGNTLENVQRGSIFRGFPGDQIAPVGPNVPASDCVPWLALMLRIIAVGAGVSYEEAYRDYTKGSWSSVRAAMSSDKKRFRPLQEFGINHFGNPTVRRFDETAVANYAAGFPSPVTWLTQRDETWDRQEWSAPGWESPNPKDDQMANKLGLETGSLTHQEIQGRKGRNWKKHFKQRALEQGTEGYPDPPGQQSGVNAQQSQEAFDDGE